MFLIHFNLTCPMNFSIVLRQYFLASTLLMTFFSHYIIIIRGMKDPLFIEIEGNFLLTLIISMLLLIRMLKSPIVHKVASWSRMLQWRLMSLMSITSNRGVILLSIAVFIGLDGFKMIVLLIVSICTHWGPLVGGCIVNREYLMLVQEIPSWRLMLKNNWGDGGALTWSRVESSLELIDWGLIM